MPEPLKVNINIINTSTIEYLAQAAHNLKEAQRIESFPELEKALLNIEEIADDQLSTAITLLKKAHNISHRSELADIIKDIEHTKTEQGNRNKSAPH